MNGDVIFESGFDIYSRAEQMGCAIIHSLYNHRLILDSTSCVALFAGIGFCHYHSYFSLLFAICEYLYQSRRRDHLEGGIYIGVRLAIY